MSKVKNAFEIGNSKEDAVVLQMKAELLIALRDASNSDNPADGAENCIRLMSLEELVKAAVSLGISPTLTI